MAEPLGGTGESGYSLTGGSPGLGSQPFEVVSPPSGPPESTWHKLAFIGVLAFLFLLVSLFAILQFQSHPPSSQAPAGLTSFVVSVKVPHRLENGTTALSTCRESCTRVKTGANLSNCQIISCE